MHENKVQDETQGWNTVYIYSILMEGKIALEDFKLHKNEKSLPFESHDPSPKGSGLVVKA